MLSNIPAELHLEILRRLDVPSIFSMRAVNHHFLILVDTNQDTIFRPCLHNVECVGPHAILLGSRSSPNDSYNMGFVKAIYNAKRTMMCVAQICGITQNAKIEALYCIDETRRRAFFLWSKSWNTWNDPAGQDISTTDISKLREEILGQYTTPQLQHMVSTSIRLVFKIAELMGHNFHGSTLHYHYYSRYNSYLVANGLGLLVKLEGRNEVGRREYLKNAIWDGVFPNMHDELIRYLETRGSGLMTDPGIEIQQFFREEDTLLDSHSHPADV
jgi:hypothetical protein